MDAPGTITAAQFAGLTRDHMHSVLEAARARRTPDEVTVTSGAVTAPLDAALADKIWDFILASEDVPSDDGTMTSHLAP